MSTSIIIFLIFSLPFVIFPFGSTPFEIPKVIVFGFGVQFLLLAKALEKKPFLASKPNKTALGIVLVIFIHTLLTLGLWRGDYTFFGNPYRLQGIFLLWGLIAFSFLSSGALVTVTPKIPLVSLIGIFISSLVILPNIAGRRVGFLGDPNTLAAAAVFLWPLTLGFSSRLPKIAALSVALLTIFLSGSRSGFLAIAMETFLLAIFLYKKVNFKLLAIGGFLIIGAGMFLPNLEKGRAWENRYEIWKTAISAASSRPVLGYGFGNVETALRQASLAAKNNLRFEYVDSSHNIFLDYLLEGGMIGLSAIAGLVILITRRLVKTSNLPLLLSFLGILVMLTFNPPGIVTLVWFWYFVGNAYSRS